MIEQIEWDCEDVVGNEILTWNVVVVIDCDFDPPDETTGYRGGWDVACWSYKRFQKFNDKCELVLDLTENQFVYAFGEQACKVLKEAADRDVMDNEDRIKELAAEKAEQKDIAARESADEFRFMTSRGE